MSTHAVPIMVLPGLDGSVGMLTKFRDLAPHGFDVTLLELPHDGDSYVRLAQHLSDTIAGTRHCVLIAESFSGPLAVMLALQHPQSVAALVLVASFVTSPLPFVARCVPWSAVFRYPLPAWVARRYMLGAHCEPSLVCDLREAVGATSARVLTHRLREISRIDVTKALLELTCPVMYLRPTDDALVPQRCVETIRRLRPDAAIYRIQGPHLILETRPNDSWQQVVDFVGLSSIRAHTVPSGRKSRLVRCARQCQLTAT